MTYNEWRDELKSNLLSVPERERRRVLDYYAEAYADRRDAGFSEREIIEDFGAPYDAAQRILAENGSEYSSSNTYYDEHTRKDERDIRREEKERRLEMKQREREERRRREEYEREECRREQERERERRNTDYRDYSDPFYDDKAYTPTPPAPQNTQKVKRGDDYTWVFVLLCIIFCVPLFGLIMAMVGITIGFCVAPFALLIAGVATAGAGIGTIVSGEALAGLCTVGVGIMIFGVSIILIAIFPRLVKLMWTLFKKTMSFIKSLFSGKETV